MRATIHLVSRGDYWPTALAIRAARRKQWNRPAGPTRARCAAGGGSLRAAIAEGPMPRKQIDELLGGGSVLTNGGRAVAGPGPGAALGDLGAPAGRPLRGRRGLAGRSEGSAGRGSPSCWCGAIWAASGRPPARRSPTGRGCHRGISSRRSRTGAAPLRGRGRRRAARPAPGAAASIRRPRRRPGSCRSGTRPCSCTPGAPGSCPRSTARRSSTRGRRSRSTPSSSTAGGRNLAPREGTDRSQPLRPPQKPDPAASWRPRPRAWLLPPVSGS